MPVVVAQNGQDGQAEVGTRRREDFGLLGPPVCGQVTAQQDKIGLLGHRRHGLGHLGPDAFVTMNVAGGGNSQDAAPVSVGVGHC
jgi:hypothetical protein